MDPETPEERGRRRGREWVAEIHVVAARIKAEMAENPGKSEAEAVMNTKDPWERCQAAARYVEKRREPGTRPMMSFEEFESLCHEQEEAEKNKKNMARDNGENDGDVDENAESATGDEDLLVTSMAPDLQKQASIPMGIPHRPSKETAALGGVKLHASKVRISRLRPRRVTLELPGMMKHAMLLNIETNTDEWHQLVWQRFEGGLRPNIKYETKYDPRDYDETEWRDQIDSEFGLASKKQAILGIGLVKQDNEQEIIVNVWATHHSSSHPTISWRQLQDHVDAAEDESHVRLVITTRSVDALTSPKEHPKKTCKNSGYDSDDECLI